MRLSLKFFAKLLKAILKCSMLNVLYSIERMKTLKEFYVLGIGKVIGKMLRSDVYMVL